MVDSTQPVENSILIRRDVILACCFYNIINKNVGYMQNRGPQSVWSYYKMSASQRDRRTEKENCVAISGPVCYTVTLTVG